MSEKKSATQFSSDFSQVISVAKGLYVGNINEPALFPFPPYPTAERETVTMILDSLDRFMGDKGEDYRTYDREGQQPKEYVEALKELGLFGLIIPEAEGGIGLSNVGYSRVLQQSSRYDASTSLTIGAHSSIGMKGILLFGNPQQRARYLPKLASGEYIAAFCLTEPGSGSDAASIKTNATKNSDGSYILNGEKIWITNGAFADVFTVFARTGGEAGQLTAFIVERSFAGVSSGPKEDKMGIRASATTAVRFDNVRVPAENVLGEAGKGFKVAMAILNNGRTGLGGGCVGAMKQSIERSIRQALDRKQFGRSISEFALIKEKIAEMTVRCYAAESVVHLVASLIDAGHEDYSVEAAMSKVFVSEQLWWVANEAVQIAGGNGFMREYPFERVVRDSRINMIFEGTNEILRLYIALSSLKDAGDELKAVVKGISTVFNDPIKGFGVMSSYATKKFAQLTPVGREHLQGVAKELKPLAKILEREVVQLGAITESVLKKYGPKIVGSQLVTKRLADIGIDVLVGLCVLSRVTSAIKAKGAAACENEIRIAEIFVHGAKRRISANFAGLDVNDDTQILSLADSMFAAGKFAWDTVKE